MTQPSMLDWYSLADRHSTRLAHAEALGHAKRAPKRGTTMSVRLRLPAWLVNLATATLVLVAAAAATAQGEVVTSTSDVHRFSDFSTVEGAQSVLVHGPDFVAVTLRTSGLEPLAPYTIWWVIFNEPQNCYEACDLDDLFNPDGTMNINPDADIAILYGDGLLTDDAGAAAFSAVLFEGAPLGEVVYGPGLVDARTAEVHIVVRSHGPLAADLSRAYAQLSTFEPHPTIGGGCVECADQHFAIHYPATQVASR